MPIIPKGVFIKKYLMPIANEIGWGVFYKNYFLTVRTKYDEARTERERLENNINFCNGELPSDLNYWKCIYTKTGFWVTQQRHSTEYQWK